QDVGVGGLLHERAKVHHLIGHWGFLGCVEIRNPTLPENHQWPPAAARSLGRYGERASQAACSIRATPSTGTRPLAVAQAVHDLRHKIAHSRPPEWME